MCARPVFAHFLLVFGLATTTHAAEPSDAIAAIAGLTDPAKLARLTGERAANDRLHKIMAWLEEARRAGMHPGKTLDEA